MGYSSGFSSPILCRFWGPPSILSNEYLDP